MSAAPTGGCSVGNAANTWHGGFTATVTVKNTGTTAIDGWKLAFDFPTSDQKVGQGWSATWKQAGRGLDARSRSNRSVTGFGSDWRYKRTAR